MLTELRWIASLPASALSAAHAVVDGQQLTTPELVAELKGPAGNLGATLEECCPDAPRLWPHLIALAAGIPQPHELAEVALTKSLPRDQARVWAPRIGESIRQVVAAFRTAVPDLLDELSLRSGPMRQQWEARGPGLLAAAQRTVGPVILVDRADVVLVHPVLGGAGDAFPKYNTVTFEAVLADPVPQLPEVLRLAWLVSQLGCDRPQFQEQLRLSSKLQQPASSDFLEAIVSLALVPVILKAAEEVELAVCDLMRLELAIQSWKYAAIHRANLSPNLLFDWWATYLNSGSQWNIALSALLQMACDDGAAQ